MGIDARERLIVALDFPRDLDAGSPVKKLKDAQKLIDELREVKPIFKLGAPVFMVKGGFEIHWNLIKENLKVFLDFKFWDTADTVKRAVFVAAKTGVSFVTVNGSMQVVKAAVQARNQIPNCELQILTVTLLSSLDHQDLDEMGITTSVEEYIDTRAKQAKEVGCDGVIVSGQQIGLVRNRFPEPGSFKIVAPGIRPAGSAYNDHKRFTTPVEAIELGADYLVVGRPIVGAAKPLEAAKDILREMQTAFNKRGW